MTSWTRWAVVASAALFAVLYFVTALPRIFYPYDLDFIEDSMLMEAWQFARGLPVFVSPNADFMPHQYMPLYSWLGGVLLNLTGVSFTPLRLFSFAAVLASAALIFYIARREAGKTWLAFGCAGLYLGGFRLTGQWYELVRVDSLFIFLSLGGMALAIYGKGRTGWMLASAVVLALAFWTKQTALLYGIGFALWFVYQYGPRAVWFIVSYTVLIVVPFWLLNTATAGWFRFHTVTLSGSDPVEWERLVRYVLYELFGVMAGVSLLALITAAFFWHKDHNPLGWLRTQPWLLALGLAVLVSGIGRASVGGNLNNLMSAYALLCLAPAFILKASTNARLPRFLSPRRIELVIVGAVLLQFLLGAYNPLRYMPTPAMQTAGDRLVARIAAEPGSVLVMMHPYYALRAGKPPSAQILTLWYTYVLGGMPLPDDFVTRFRTKYYSTIISDESTFETDPAIRALLDENYVLTETLAPTDAPPTLTGVVVRPVSVYRPKP